jgi:hypothetical protein
MPRYYRTVFVYEVLTEGEPLTNVGLRELEYHTTEGHASGMFLSEETEEISEEHMRRLLIAQGSDPEFLISDEEEVE